MYGATSTRKYGIYHLNCFLQSLQELADFTPTMLSPENKITEKGDR